MRHSIEGFRQDILIEFGLDCVDSVILRYIVDYWNTNKMVKIQVGDKSYFWLKYQSVIDTIPIIGIKTKIALSRRLDKYVKSGIMEHHTHRVGGTFSCYRFTDKYIDLIDFDIYVKAPEKSKEKTIPDYVKTASKEIIGFLNKLTGKNFIPLSDSNLKIIKTRISDGFSVKDLKHVVKNMVFHWSKKNNKKDMSIYLRPSTLFNKSKIENYLNMEIPKEKESEKNQNEMLSELYK